MFNGQHLFVILWLTSLCVAENRYYFKSAINRRGNYSTIFQNVTGADSAIQCGRICNDAENCLAASFCEPNCHLSNQTTDHVFLGLTVDNCTYIELTKVCKGGGECEKKVKCPLDYHQVGRLCFKYYLETVTYAVANSTCYERNGHLMVLESDEDMITVHNACKGKKCRQIWVDGKGGVIWNGKPIPYQKWKDAQGMNAEECPSLYTELITLQKNKCDNEQEFLCQIEVN